MSTQTAVEQKATPHPAGNGGGAGAGAPGTLPVPQPPVQKLKSERVQEELKAMPAWQLARDEKAIACVKTFPTPEVAALYAAFASRFASAAGFAVTVSLSGGQVCVTVYAQQINGCPGELTESVLGFAKQLG